jgi:hypothetical protein
MTTPKPDRLIDRLENYYDFESTGGPLKNCVEWQQLKGELSTLRAQLSGLREALETLNEQCRQMEVRAKAEQSAALGRRDAVTMNGQYERSSLLNWFSQKLEAGISAVPVSPQAHCVCEVDDGYVQEWVERARAAARMKGFAPEKRPRTVSPLPATTPGEAPAEPKIGD